MALGSTMQLMEARHLVRRNTFGASSPSLAHVAALPCSFVLEACHDKARNLPVEESIKSSLAQICSWLDEPWHARLRHTCLLESLEPTSRWRMLLCASDDVRTCAERVGGSTSRRRPWRRGSVCQPTSWVGRTTEAISRSEGQSSTSKGRRLVNHLVGGTMQAVDGRERPQPVTRIRSRNRHQPAA